MIKIIEKMEYGNCKKVYEFSLGEKTTVYKGKDVYIIEFPLVEILPFILNDIKKMFKYSVLFQKNYNSLLFDVKRVEIEVIKNEKI